MDLDYDCKHSQREWGAHHGVDSGYCSTHCQTCKRKTMTNLRLLFLSFAPCTMHLALSPSLSLCLALLLASMRNGDYETTQTDATWFIIDKKRFATLAWLNVALKLGVLAELHILRTIPSKNDVVNEILNVIFVIILSFDFKDSSLCIASSTTKMEFFSSS